MTPAQGQRMLFSATLDAAVDVLARRFMNHPAHHDVGPVEAPVTMVHHLLTVEPSDRVGVVAALAGGSGRSLVFTRTKHAARRLARQLATSGVPAAELHGDLSQGARERNLASFAAGAVRVIVATDVAARGIHVDGIDLVIHADSPAEHKAFLHRSGRTARAGATGTVVTLHAPVQAAAVRDLMRKAGVVPLTATVTPGSALLRSIAGKPVARVTLPAVRPEAITASAGTGHGAVALSAGFRGRRGR
jgi:superfamily II DNA/RNA helicase